MTSFENALWMARSMIGHWGRSLSGDLNGRAPDREELLWKAAGNGRLEEDPTFKMNALMFAAAEGFFLTLEELLKSGASVSASDKNGYSSLHFAAISNYEDTEKIIGKLVEFGADVESLTNKKITPLYLAVLKNQIRSIQTLIKLGADVNFCLTARGDRFTPLHMAAQKGHLSAIKLLVENGADVHLKDRNGCTALSLAEKENHEEIVEYLGSVM
ncbi:unnamed protein product [Caenorhabditis auriculariae]|uniref:Ankyrin repeat domain-containing protein n=1 Tax=Caenorhabditis auriculariae TaxID=2777116 RepID=A0A8S1HUP3_9PELO|nr:unnamed protein product [Caenorhabditis auriculariae]